MAGLFVPAMSIRPFTTLTLVGMTIGSDDTIEFPDTLAPGDIGVIWNSCFGEQAPSAVLPDGFTSLVNGASGETGADTRSIISAKVMTGAETAVSGMHGTSTGADDRWIAALFRPDASIASLAGNGFATRSDNNNPAALSLTLSAVAPPILVVGHMRDRISDGDIDPRITSPAMTEIATGSTHYYAHYRIYNGEDTPANQSYDMDDEGGVNFMQLGYISFTPA